MSVFNIRFTLSSFVFTVFGVEFLPGWVIKYQMNFLCATGEVRDNILFKQKVSILFNSFMLTQGVSIIANIASTTATCGIQGGADTNGVLSDSL